MIHAGLRTAPIVTLFRNSYIFCPLSRFSIRNVNGLCRLHLKQVQLSVANVTQYVRRACKNLSSFAARCDDLNLPNYLSLPKLDYDYAAW
jgi:hypothetical protein